MLPIKDNLPHERLPLVPLVLVAANVLAYAIPARPLPLGPTLLDVVSLALFGASVESRLGHARAAALGLVGAAAGAALCAALGEGAGGALAAWAAAGATAASLIGYLVLFPRARVISLVLVPFVVTIVEVPAVLLLGAWTGAQLYLRLSG